MIQSIVAEINIKTGESECRYYKERLLYLEESQRDLLIDSSRILSCHGELKNNRGAVSITWTLKPCLDLFACRINPDKTVTIYASRQMVNQIEIRSCYCMLVASDVLWFRSSFSVAASEMVILSGVFNFLKAYYTYYMGRAFGCSVGLGEIAFTLKMAKMSVRPPEAGWIIGLDSDITSGYNPATQD